MGFKKKIKFSFYIFRTIVLAFFIFVLLPLEFVFAQTDISPKGVAVFTAPGSNTADIALSIESAEYIKKIFTDCGRFIPMENREIETAYNIAAKESRTNEKNLYYETAEILNLDLFVLVSVYQLGNIIYSDVNVVPLNNEYRSMEKRIRLRSRMKLNMPLKIGREITLLHKNLPVKASIIKAYDNSLYLIDAGEWHGIQNNAVYKLPDCNIQMIQTGRFESIVKIPVSKNAGEGIVINIFPDTEKIIRELDDDISRNTISMYGLDAQGNSEKRLLEGICIVNMGGNLCFPGYGAFLSTGYLGFKDPKPDMAGVTISTSAIAIQLLLPELLTGFKVNFLPWKQDADKTGRMQDMQKFLWATLPVTFSVAYMDQLAFQFTVKENLPPFFIDKDNSAVLFSLFLPGGGLFYKGHRLAGWNFYFSEMLTAGYGVYNYDSKSGKYALYAFGAIKLLDIIYAYFVSPSYSFYNLEKEREISPASLNMGIRRSPDGHNIFNIMITKNL